MLTSCAKKSEDFLLRPLFSHGAMHGLLATTQHSAARSATEVGSGWFGLASMEVTSGANLSATL